MTDSRGLDLEFILSALRFPGLSFSRAQIPLAFFFSVKIRLLPNFPLLCGGTDLFRLNIELQNRYIFLQEIRET